MNCKLDAYELQKNRCCIQKQPLRSFQSLLPSPIRKFRSCHTNMIMRNILAALVLLCQLLDAHKRRSHLHNGLPKPNRICTRHICHLYEVLRQWEKATIALLHAPSEAPADSSSPWITKCIIAPQLPNCIFLARAPGKSV
jgi:hypothetical protein